MHISAYEERLNQRITNSINLNRNNYALKVFNHTND